MNKVFHKLFAVLAVTILMSVSVVPVFAKVDFVGEESVDLTDQVYEDDVMIGGAFVNGDFTVVGDSFIAGNMLEISGTFGDDMNIVGGQVELSGEIADDLRMAGGTVVLDGKVGSDAFLAGGQVTITKDSVISDELYVGAGMVRLFGTVNGDVYLGAGQAVVSGVINGDLTIEAEDISISDTAQINGNLIYKSNNEIKDLNKENISGTVEYTPISEIDLSGVGVNTGTVGGLAVGAGIVAQITGFIVGLLMLFIVGLAMVLIVPGFSDRTSKFFTGQIGWSLLYGLVAMIVLPVLSILIMITIIGLPLGIITFVLYFVGLYIAKVVAAMSVGSAIIGRKKKNLSILVLSLALGLFIYELITMIPIVGGFINLVMVMVGYGAIMLWFTKRHKA